MPVCVSWVPEYTDVGTGVPVCVGRVPVCVGMGACVQVCRVYRWSLCVHVGVWSLVCVSMGACVQVCSCVPDVYWVWVPVCVCGLCGLCVHGYMGARSVQMYVGCLHVCWLVACVCVVWYACVYKCACQYTDVGTGVPVCVFPCWCLCACVPVGCLKCTDGYWFACVCVPLLVPVCAWVHGCLSVYSWYACVCMGVRCLCVWYMGAHVHVCSWVPDVYWVGCLSV